MEEGQRNSYVRLELEYLRGNADDVSCRHPCNLTYSKTEIMQFVSRTSVRLGTFANQRHPIDCCQFAFIAEQKKMLASNLLASERRSPVCGLPTEHKNRTVHGWCLIFQEHFLKCDHLILFPVLHIYAPCESCFREFPLYFQVVMYGKILFSNQSIETD